VSTIHCPVCSTDVSDKLSRCPRCGEPLGTTMFDPQVLRPPPAPKSPAPEAPAPPPRDAVYSRFILCRVLLQPLELDPKESVRVGRNRENEICLPSTHVSRVHSEIVWENGAWVVGDLGSKNGTYVNDQRVVRHTLAHEDRISIGHFELRYQELTREETFQLLRRPDSSCGHDTAPLRAVPEGFIGNLSNLPVEELVQLLMHNRKDGVLEVSLSGSAPPAELYFADGEIIDALYGKHRGEDAARAILRLKAGRFAFKQQAVRRKRTVELPTDSLLLDVLSG